MVLVGSKFEGLDLEKGLILNLSGLFQEGSSLFARSCRNSFGLVLAVS